MLVLLCLSFFRDRVASQGKHKALNVADEPRGIPPGRSSDFPPGLLAPKPISLRSAVLRRSPSYKHNIRVI